jgi:hypothetical protein
MKSIQQIISYFKNKPNHLFLADAMGALLTALLSGVLLVKLEYLFGMPIKVLYVLSILASIFTIYSFLCFLFIEKNFSLYFLIIAIANSFYCILTTILMIYYFNNLKLLAKLFFPLEIMTILIVVYFEVRIIKELKH